MRMRSRTLILLLVLVMVLVFSAVPTLAQEEETVGPLEALGINAGFLIAQVINFALLFGGLTFFLWRPITNMLDARSEKIAKGLEDASAAANARRNAEDEAEKILQQARTEAQSIISEARNQGEDVAKSVESEARQEAERIRESARMDAKAERDAELAGLRDQVVAISVAMTRRLINAQMDQKKQSELVADFLARVPASAKNLSGDVTVISAMPLTDKEQGDVKKAVGGGDVTFQVDPAILGGLVIRAGDRVVDGSVRSNLNDMAENLN